MMKPKINSQHEFISMSLGNNRTMTVSRSGVRGKGKIPQEVFSFWDEATRFKPEALQKLGLRTDARSNMNPEGVTMGQVIQAFADQIDTIWPEWAVAPALPTVGQEVRISFGKKKGMDSGVVEKVKGTMITARFSREGLVSFPADMIEQG
jgi:hypothetical protein